MEEKDFILGLTTCILVVFISMLSFVHFGLMLECNAKAKALNYTSDYGLLQGCVLIKNNGEKALLEQLRIYN